MLSCHESVLLNFCYYMGMRTMRLSILSALEHADTHDALEKHLKDACRTV